MTKEQPATDHQENAIKPQRPFLFTILCTAYLVYAGFFTVVFLIALLKNQWVAEVLTDYAREKGFSSTSVLLFSVGGLLTYFSSFIGTVLMLKMKRIGFYIFLFSNAIIILVPHILRYGNWYASGIFLLITILFAAFFRKLH